MAVTQKVATYCGLQEIKWKPEAEGTKKIKKNMLKWNTKLENCIDKLWTNSNWCIELMPTKVFLPYFYIRCMWQNEIMKDGHAHRPTLDLTTSISCKGICFFFNMASLWMIFCHIFVALVARAQKRLFFEFPVKILTPPIDSATPISYKRWILRRPDDMMTLLNV